MKPTTYALPPADFSYGRTERMDDEGAGAAIASWKTHEPKPEGLAGRDFVRLNKCAISEGAINSKHISMYRKSNDIRVKPVSSLSSAGAVNKSLSHHVNRSC